MLRRLGLARSGDGKVAGDGVGIVSVAEQRERAQILLDKSESDPDELLMQSGRFLEMLAALAVLPNSVVIWRRTASRRPCKACRSLSAPQSG